MDGGVTELTDKELIEEAQSCYRRARDFTSKWRTEAREDFDFRDGTDEQWTDIDRAAMKDQNRPYVSFNRVKPLLMAVSGQEANSRHETTYKPRTIDDSGLCEAAKLAVDMPLQECDAQSEEAEAFLDMLTCGMGWTEDAMDYDGEPDGALVRMRVDPLEMYWDGSSKKKNLADARWLIRVTDVDSAALKMQYPDMPESGDGEMWLDAPVEDEDQHMADQAWRYEFGPSGKKEGRTRLMIYQWFDLKKQIVATIQGKRDSWPWSEKLAKRLDEVGIKYVTVRQRVYYTCTLANGAVLERKESPIDGFTYKCMTGSRDRNRNVYYGVVRHLKDPQRWSNKFFSSMIDIVASNSKGGIMAEKGAFTDIRQAEATWASPKRITIANDGALANNRIQPKPAAEYPTSMDKLLQFAITSMRDVSNINVELLGLADRDQPGIVETQRKQSALSSLAPYFDSLKSYRKVAGKSALEFVRRYVPDDTLARILGEKYARYIPAIRDEAAIRFDVIVDESPMSPNMKEMTWAVLGQALPGLMEMGIPVPPEVLDYMPIPAALAEEWKAYIAKQAADPMNQQMKQLGMAEKQATVQKIATQAEANHARAQKAMQPEQNGMLDAQIKIMQMRADLEKMAAELGMKREEHQMELRSRAIEHQMDVQERRDDHAIDMIQGVQQHRQSMAIQEQAGAAKVEQIKKQAKAKPAAK